MLAAVLRLETRAAVLSYESMLQLDSEYVAHVARQIGVKFTRPYMPELVDGNRKYMKEEW